MINATDLLNKTRSGELTQEEFDLIVETVRDGPYDEGLYMLINILGLVGFGEELREIVEKFLYYPAETYVSKEALKTLCLGWGLTQDYLNQVANFIRGEEWDSNEVVRMMALTIAGEYLRDSFDKDLLKLLLQVFEDLGTTPEIIKTSSPLIKGCAYKSIAIAMGKDPDEIPFADEIAEMLRSQRFSDLDEAMLQQAHDMIKDT